jgi:transglutaminase-like putative cysteine protease
MPQRTGRRIVSARESAAFATAAAQLAEGPAGESRGGRRADITLTVALWAAVLAALLPLLDVVAVGGWMGGAAVVSALLLGTGFALRRWRVAALVVTLVELAVWAVVVCAVFFRDAALAWVIPTPDVVRGAVAGVQQASSEIIVGIAPLAPTTAITFVIVSAIGVLTIVLDHVVLTARMPLLAAVALVAVWLIPAIAVPSGVDVLAFAFLAAAILVLIRAETRTREERPTLGTAGGISAVALTIGSVGVVVALVTAPVLPAPTVGAAGRGAVASIDPTLDLGDDLRRPSELGVLTVRSDATELPYLRVATLSLFDGQVWQPDRVRSAALDEGGLPEVEAEEDVRVTEYRTSVEIGPLASAYLPVPFPAVAVSGLAGSWRGVPYSRTVVTGQSSTQGQSYEVVTHVPRPTLEQIRATDAAADDVGVDVTTLPSGTPDWIAELATSVTAGATTDYDRLIALQTWFRGPEFTYSLDAPVEDGFDGAGARAVASFLQVKEGYCVHFASAFAILARALEIPTRIVVGFLPGEYTGDVVDGERVASVTTDQLHSWPESYFEGIGWVGFEPTKSLGVQTRFVPSAVVPPDSGGEDIAGPTPAASAAPSASGRPDIPDEAAGGAASALGARGADPRPYLLTIGLLLALALAPGLAGYIRRSVLRRRAAAGEVAAAWRIVQDTAVDVGAPAPASESPRAFAARISARWGAPPDAMGRLVGIVERVSYARPGGAVMSAAEARRLVADADGVRAALLAAADRPVRVRALLLPRSLVVRPGSAFADAR